ncbi:Spo0B domain-containing protein [Sporosarcina trichiuri]|uniref:Spo0B domain-containing protein n=1 Tax=Sporosarcina trichiuri TaxID=3056445 RepID=UPI0025B414FC|nr:Spo0B domain-containing protein [Sporosarcina sp. 0.2-SM1T-5]WJY28190.1 Spo0B domain-containing protein [Sporosarcina sp. 0.2-SM1T-5]
MNESELTVRQALQYARHDFLNELQLILMQMDLGRVPEARDQLLASTERMQQASRVAGLGLPALETWLLTFGWHFKAFAAELVAQTSPAAAPRQADDRDVTEFLDALFRQLEEHADPFTDNSVEIMVSAEDADWKVTLTLPVQPIPHEWTSEEREHWTAEVYKSNEYWTFTIRGH